MSMARIGVDIGGTKILAMSFAEDGAVLFEKRVATPKTYRDIIAATATLAREAGPGAIGIGAPGSADPATGLWRNSNATLSNGQALQRDLEAAIGQSIRIENDANCFALSEAYDGAGKGYGVVAFYTVGTGLGGGLVVNGKLIRGAHAEAGEFGHVSLPWMEPEDLPPLECICGHKGCAEMYVSGLGFSADYQRATGLELQGPDIIARARAGEAEAEAALKRLQHRFARIIGNLINTIDPDVIVMGGGMSALRELVEDMPQLARQHSYSRNALPKISRAVHGDSSGARGAARLW
jgi:fructokinase